MGKIVILIVYVDDMILTHDDIGKLEVLKKYLAREFEVKDLGTLRYFLSMEFARIRKGILCHKESMYLSYLRKSVYLVANQWKPQWSPILGYNQQVQIRW